MAEGRRYRTWLQYLPAVLLIVAGLAAWQIYTSAARVPEFLWPGPVAVWRAAAANRDLLVQNALPTFETALLGFLLAVALGLVAAIAIHFSRTLELALYPVVIASQTVPLIALAPVLVIVLGFSLLPKLIIVCLICFFPVVVNAVDGFRSVDPDLVNLMRSMGARRLRIFRDVEWPTALPSIFAAAKVAVTYSLIGALYGELAGSWEGLQYFIEQKTSQFDTPAAFAAMAVLTLLGIGMFVIVSLLERLFLPWYVIERRRAGNR